LIWRLATTLRMDTAERTALDGGEKEKHENRVARTSRCVLLALH
jgi:hypothetical protein